LGDTVGMADLDGLVDGTDATGLAAAVRDGVVSAAEVLEHALARLDERNPGLNAIVNRRDDEARAEVAAGLPDGPFTGVPFVVKDLGVSVGGMPATGGSRLFADLVAARDSELIARYRRAGVVIVGTTNTPELGRNASTEPLLFGPTRNPWRPTHSPGGSSGGTAAAIASGMVPVGHGNDGGGSIRIPASACGLVGLKPTRGRTPVAPKPALTSPLSINHVLTRSVRDAAVFLDATAGPVAGDPHVTPPPLRPWAAELGQHPGSLRIALCTHTPAGDPVHPDCASVTTGVASLLAELGHRVEEAAPPFPAADVSLAFRVFMAASLSVEVDARTAELGRSLRDDDLEPLTRMIYEQGRSLSGGDVVHALAALERASQTIGGFFADGVLLLTPTLARPVPPLGLLDTTDLTSIATHAAAYSAMASPFNVTGQPAISLPMGHDSEGLPVGVQLVAPFGREDLLVQVASQLEEARPWRTAPVWPPGSATP
jgi:amidase